MKEQLQKNLARAAELEKQFNRAGFGFIFTDLETSILFATLALNAGKDEEKRNRNRMNARRGYEAVLHFMNRFDVSSVTTEEYAELTGRLKNLRSALEKLGERLE